MTHQPNGSPASDGKVRVYYDGACPLCTGSVTRLKSRDRNDAVVAISTADPDFDADREGLRKELLGKMIQVKDPEGRIHAGLDGMIVAWRAVPTFRPLAGLASIPGVYQVGKVAYAWFARNRYRFTRRCDDLSCRPNS